MGDDYFVCRNVVKFNTVIDIGCGGASYLFYNFIVIDGAALLYNCSDHEMAYFFAVLQTIKLHDEQLSASYSAIYCDND
jgi:hypothetical protein